MVSGGARNRSGPPPDPDSGRSERRGLVLTALPNEGYRGRMPKYPLPKVEPHIAEPETGRDGDEAKDSELTSLQRWQRDVAEQRWERERALWRWAWRTPQAAAWALEPWRWHSVAMWVRTAVLCESADAQAADKNSLHRFADQIGLTPAGLAQNGWAIAAPEIVPVEPIAARDAEPDDDAAPAAPVRRLRT